MTSTVPFAKERVTARSTCERALSAVVGVPQPMTKRNGVVAELVRVAVRARIR
jgi:hypothetical protein